MADKTIFLKRCKITRKMGKKEKKEKMMDKERNTARCGKIKSYYNRGEQK